MTSQVNMPYLETDGSSVSGGVTIDGTASSVPELSTSCTKCDDLLRTPESSLGAFECYSYVTLGYSARSGCKLCALVFAQAQLAVAELDDTWEPYLNLPYLAGLRDRDNRWTLHFQLKRDRDREGYLAFIDRLEWQEENSRFQHHITHKNTGSIPNMKLAQNWMRVCQESHTECIAHSYTHHTPPTRLIDIGLFNDDVRLSVMESHTTQNPRWATLSHCWGKLDFIKLSRQNLASFQTSIPYPDLPLTFKHAIEVARNFNFRYIWIDSLCIIQDDKDDWEKEAPRMASVYGGSSLNISGAAAHDGRDGLFFDRDANLVQRCLLHVDLAPLPTWFLAASPISERNVKILDSRNRYKRLFYYVDSAVYDHSFSLPLFQRAWIFQERFLAPRTLHFGDTQIFWECQSQICFETFPNGMPDGSNLAFNTHETWVMQKTKGSQKLWNSVLAHYSQCKLTNASDKLIAISGVADIFASHYGGNYLWGIWREHLPMALLWTPRDKTASRPLPLLAPTWSWASISGPIRPDFSYGLISETYTSIHTHFPPPSTPETKILQLKCEKLFKPNPQTARQVYGDNTWWSFTVPGVNSLPPVEFSAYLYFDGVDHKRSDLPLAMYALCFYTSATGDEAGLLIQCVEGKKGYFRRVGVYQIYDQKCPTFVLARRFPLTDFDREVVYETVSASEDGVESKFVINLE